MNIYNGINLGIESTPDFYRIIISKHFFFKIYIINVIRESYLVKILVRPSIDLFKLRFSSRFFENKEDWKMISDKAFSCAR